MFKVSVHCGGMAQTNGYLVSTEGDQHLLIDAPGGAASWLESLGIRIDSLLLTHLHYDHVVDAAEIQKNHSCTVIAREASCTPELTLESILRAMGMPVAVAPFEIDQSLKNSETVVAGGIEFSVLHVPGHSPDSICFRPAVPDDSGNRVLFGGDVLFQGSVGRTDFPNGSMDLLTSGIREKLYTLPSETIVYPGHGPATTIGAEMKTNPFVRPK